MSRKGEVVSDGKAIFYNYLKGWFVVDVLAALPFDFLNAHNLFDGEVSFFSSFLVKIYEYKKQVLFDWGA